MKHFYLLLLTFVLFGSLNAQKSIVIIGSSTAFGQGANPYDSSWAGRLQSYYRKNISAGDPDTVVTNLALGGQWTFSCMPTWYVPPPGGYPNPNPARNITAAIALNPDVIIVNLPSNDQIWPFPKWMTMNNFRTIYNEAHIYNKRIFITTTQPINNPDLTIRDSLRTLVDSIKNNFGVFSIDFWTPIVSPAGDSTIRSDLNSGDGTHVNNTGHRLLFEQVIAKDLFPAAGPLPLKLLSFDARAGSTGITLQWTTTEEEPSTKFEIQRSANGREFSSKVTLDGTGDNGISNYSWTDLRPLDGKNYYMLKIIEPSKTSYSKIVVIGKNEPAIDIGSVYTDADALHIRINNNKYETLEVSVASMSGVIVKKQKTAVTGGGEIVMSISDLAPGKYIVFVADTKGNVGINKFSRF